MERIVGCNVFFYDTVHQNWRFVITFLKPLISEGSYSCACNDGFEGNGASCSDINECKLGVCADNALCVNTVGSFSCDCSLGFTGDAFNSCEDRIKILMNYLSQN